MKKFTNDFSKCCLLFFYSVFTPSAFLILAPMGYVKRKPYFPKYMNQLADLGKWYVRG